MKYTIRNTDQVPLFAWERFAAAETAVLANFGGPAKEFPPEVRFRALHDRRNIYGMFEVREHGVTARKTAFQEMVCQDSCCEFFFQPPDCGGYFNLEMNAGGTFLIFFVRDPNPSPENGMPSDFTPLGPTEGNFITVKTDLPAYIPEPIMKETLYHVMFTVPMEALEPYCGRIAPLSGQIWRGNLYKCGDFIPYPWELTWAKIDCVSFHAPHCFQELVFE